MVLQDFQNRLVINNNSIINNNSDKQYRRSSVHSINSNIHNRNSVTSVSIIAAVPAGAMTDAAVKSAQGNRVQLELEQLREKQLAKNQRDRLKDLCSPLTTPEQAQAFLAAMRDKSHQREFLHVPPSNLSSDGMDAWYRKQKQHEKEMRQRRREAEALLRGYRGSGEYTYHNNTNGNGGNPLSSRESISSRRSAGGAFLMANSVVTTPELSEALDDPRSFKHIQANTQFGLDQDDDDEDGVDEEDSEKRMRKVFRGDKFKEDRFTTNLSAASSEEEKKEDHFSTQMLSRPPRPSSAPVVTKKLTVWRSFVSTVPEAKFLAEANRYHLYLSYACPGSHRALIVRALKGLEETISVTFVHPTWRLTNPEDPDDRHRGWVFGDPFGEPFSNTIGRGGPFPPAYPGNEPDPQFNAFSIRQIYEHAEDTSGKYTIPLLWDKKLKTIVNNDSSDITYMLNSCFNDFASDPELDLYTEDDEEGVAKLNEVSEWLSPLMIHGVYRCGFAKNQRAYDKAIAELCEAFDRADDILQRSRYLTGNTLTDADIRLFVTLLRFDEVYAFYFKANARLVMLTPSLLNFCRDIYQISGIAETCNMDQIKAHFFGSHAEWNKYSVVPRGLGFMELLEMPHDRDSFITPPHHAEEI